MHALETLLRCAVFDSYPIFDYFNEKEEKKCFQLFDKSSCSPQPRLFEINFLLCLRFTSKHLLRQFPMIVDSPLFAKAIFCESFALSQFRVAQNQSKDFRCFNAKASHEDCATTRHKVLKKSKVEMNVLRYITIHSFHLNSIFSYFQP